ncbi:MAG: tRNA uridine-5-carboxymethylaminomethyl(34) synthesis GTPase MnmE [Alphaproteobacteria bacterium]|nr:tRNA uridine-5-carboxymethylaminomethyl(34) synthesis GTPase MnmE [Alphaproteobacteria bacterium]
MTDTIFALSSGKGRAGVAVVRVSGKDLCNLLYKVTTICHSGKGQSGSKKINCKDPGPAPGLRRGRLAGLTARYAYFTDLIDLSGDIIDKIIAIYFKAPASFTGEDVVEFHVHGSDAVLAKLFDILKSLGARMAERGEFARRAFDNNKMDLIEVDGLAALIDSRTEQQRRAALRTAAGADSDTYMRWRQEMIDIAAYSAAMLDYPDEELPENIGEKLATRTQKLYDELSVALSRAGAARAVRSGFNIALVGDVNAGKSSLFNAIVGESRAIVSDIAGTTRDVISAEIDMDGYLVRLLDTAGLRETTDAIENMGIERTNKEIENADLILRVRSKELGVRNDNELTVYNKSDLIKYDSSLLTPYSLLVSAKTGDGIPELLDLIKTEVHARLAQSESDVVVNERTKGLLTDAANELKLVLVGVGSSDPSGGETPPLHNPELFAEHVNAAADKIGAALGVIGIDEIMDATFGQLCLGK